MSKTRLELFSGVYTLLSMGGILCVIRILRLKKRLTILVRGGRYPLRSELFGEQRGFPIGKTEYIGYKGCDISS